MLRDRLRMHMQAAARVPGRVSDSAAVICGIHGPENTAMRRNEHRGRRTRSGRRTLCKPTPRRPRRQPVPKRPFKPALC